jgi:hypothetical protein
MGDDADRVHRQRVQFLDRGHRARLRLSPVPSSEDCVGAIHEFRTHHDICDLVERAQVARLARCIPYQPCQRFPFLLSCYLDVSFWLVAVARQIGKASVLVCRCWAVTIARAAGARLIEHLSCLTHGLLLRCL